jgi:flagellar operon protein
MTVQNVYQTGYPQGIEPRQASFPSRTGAQGTSFNDLFRQKVGALKFSAHATSRMSSRNIGMTPELVDKLEKAVSGAAVKGARDSLVLMKNCAFIVNIPNRTVVTAMDGESLKENIFTNIDSAVIAD